MDKKSTKESKINKVNESEIKRLKRAINHIAETPDGEVLLRFIKNESGFGKSDIVADPQTGRIDLNGTLVNASTKLLYNRIRSYMDPKNIIKIEFAEMEEKVQ